MSIPSLNAFTPEELSKLPAAENTSGVSLVGYDQDNPAKLVRVDAESFPTLDEDGKLDLGSIPTEDLEITLRQGTDAERQTITPASGEPIWTTDTKQLYIGDGSTVGGVAAGGAPPIYQLRVGDADFYPAAANTPETAASAAVSAGVYLVLGNFQTIDTEGGFFYVQLEGTGVSVAVDGKTVSNSVDQLSLSDLLGDTFGITAEGGGYSLSGVAAVGSDQTLSLSVTSASTFWQLTARSGLTLIKIA